jgi:RNA polymerase sigma factor (sigma-70 family)
MDELAPTGTDADDGPGTAMGDADLVAQVRDGHDEPYAELYRRHQGAALALARTLTEHASADDLVSEAFEKLLQRIRGGRGPAAAFRPYLLRTVRTVAVDASRRTRRPVVAEDPQDAAGAASRDDDALVDAVHERTTLARAFAALPERWQTVLWLSFVDHADRGEIATILGTNVGSVSALGYRAREGLRRAYLDAHLRDAPTPECAEVWPLLATATRGGLGPTQQAKVDEHLAGCDHCRSAAAELEAVNTRFGAVLAPIVLGAAAPAYLAAVQHGAATAPADATAAVTATATAEAGAEGGADASSGHGSGLKATVAGWGKVGAAGVAVAACASTVALVGLLAVFTAPLASEPSVAPRPGASVPGGSSRGPGSDGTDGGGTTDASYGTGSTPGEPTSSTESGDPSTAATPSTPLPTALPTATTTGGPTALPTFTTTVGPTAGPTSVPTGGTKPPTPTPSGTGTRPPTPGGTPTAPTPTSGGPTSTPSTTPTVDAALGSLDVQSRNQTSYPAHVAIPVFLDDGRADLQLLVTVVGLNKFVTTSGAGEGAWGCVATTPMAGAGRTAMLRCTIDDAGPNDALNLGLDLGYAGDGSISAVLGVLGDAVDKSLSDNTASADLPPRQG